MNNMNTNDAYGVVAESYKTLGLPLCATEQEIRSAYKRLARKYHPDRPGGSNEKFVALQNAYEILTGHTKNADLQSEGSAPTAEVRPFDGGESSFDNKDALRAGNLDVQTYIKEKAAEARRLDMNYSSQLKFDYGTPLDEERDFFISFPITFGPRKFDPLDFVGNMSGAKGRYHNVSNSLEEAKNVAERNNATREGSPLSSLHYDLQVKGAEPFYVIYKIRCTPRVLIDNFSVHNASAFLTNVVSAYHLNYKPLRDEKYDRLAEIDMETSSNRKNAFQQINNVLSDVKPFKQDYKNLKEISFDTKIVMQKNPVEKMGLSDNAKKLLNNAAQRVLGKNITSIFPTTPTQPIAKPSTKSKEGLLNKLAKSVLGRGGISNPSMPDYDPPELPVQHYRAESKVGYQIPYEKANVEEARLIDQSLAFLMIKAKKSPDEQSSFNRGIDSLKADKCDEAKAYIDKKAKDMLAGRHQLTDENQKPQESKRNRT